MTIPRLIIITLALMGMTPCAQVEKKMDNQSITIGFLGDVMLGRSVNQKISQTDYDYVWGNMIHSLNENDLNIINLETTLTKSTNKVEKVFNFKADPDRVLALKRGNIHIANLANNHILDFSNEGLSETIKTLDQAAIKHVGAGQTIKEAKQPVIVSVKGTRIGVIGYTDNEPGWLAQKNRPGTNYIKVGDIEQVKRDIKELKSKVDILVLSIHWGPNMREVPTKEFQNFAHALIDAGVDIIHGHSAHVVQGVEIYNNKPILYDTGDFVDDYMVGPNLRNDHTFLFRVIAKNGELQRLEMIPAIISDMQVNRAMGQDKIEMIERVKNLSRNFGTQIKEYEDRLVVNIP